jgi:hypothetical protein
MTPLLIVEIIVAHISCPQQLAVRTDNLTM